MACSLPSFSPPAHICPPTVGVSLRAGMTVYIHTRKRNQPHIAQSQDQEYIRMDCLRPRTGLPLLFAHVQSSVRVCVGAGREKGRGGSRHQGGGVAENHHFPVVQGGLSQNGRADRQTYRQTDPGKRTHETSKGGEGEGREEGRMERGDSRKGQSVAGWLARASACSIASGRLAHMIFLWCSAKLNPYRTVCSSAHPRGNPTSRRLLQLARDSREP